MDADTRDLGKAVVLFIGSELSPFPKLDGSRLVEEFGLERAKDLEARANALLSELSGISIDWTLHSYLSGCKMVRNEMATRHPELPESALDALQWKFSWDWR